MFTKLKWAVIGLIILCFSETLHRMGWSFGEAIDQAVGITPLPDGYGQSLFIHESGRFVTYFLTDIMPGLVAVVIFGILYRGGDGTRAGLAVPLMIGAAMAYLPPFFSTVDAMNGQLLFVPGGLDVFERAADSMKWIAATVAFLMLVGCYVLMASGTRPLNKKTVREVVPDGPWDDRLATETELRHWFDEGEEDGLIIGELVAHHKAINWADLPVDNRTVKQFGRWLRNTTAMYGLPICSGAGYGDLLRLNPAGSLITVSGAGGGKTVSWVFPNLFFSRKTFIINDVKGEIYQKCAKVREIFFGRGQIFIDPEDKTSWGCNVVAGLGRDPDLRDVETSMIISWLKSGTTDDGSSWYKNSWSGATGMVRAMMEIAAEEGRDWSLADIGDILAQDENAVRRQMLEWAHKYPAARGSLLKCFGISADDTYSGTYASLSSYFSDFSTGVKRKLLCGKSDRVFTLTDLLNGKNDLYIRIKLSLLKEYKSSLQLLMGSINSEIVRICNAGDSEYTKKGEVKLKNQIVYLLDEFPQIAGDPSSCTINAGVQTMRSFNVIYWLFAQGMAQVKEVYGDLTPTFLDSCQTQMFCAIGDVNHAEELSKLSGFQTIRVRSFNESESAKTGGNGKDGGGVNSSAGSAENLTKEPVLSVSDIACPVLDHKGNAEEFILRQRGRPLARVGCARYYTRPSMRWLEKVGRKAGPVIGPTRVKQ